MGVRQRGASTVKTSRPRHAARRRPPAPVTVPVAVPVTTPAVAPAAFGAAQPLRFAPPLTALTAGHGPSHATSLAS